MPGAKIGSEGALETQPPRVPFLSPTDWMPGTPHSSLLSLGPDRLGWDGEGGEPPRSAVQGRAGTLAAGAALQDDDRRLAKLLRAATGGAQLAQVGVGLGVAAAHRLVAGTHAQAGLSAPSYCGRGGHPEGHHALQPLAAGTLLLAARCALRPAAHLAAVARVPDSATLTVRGRWGTACGIAALRAHSGS